MTRWVVVLRGLPAAGCAFLLGACGGAAEPAPWEVGVRDSAGVTIVQNPAEGAWTEAERWDVVEELRFGVEVAGPRLRLGSADLDVDADGRIYLLDPAASSIRVFGPEGEPLHSFGAPEGVQVPQGVGALFIGSDGTVVVPGRAPTGPSPRTYRAARFTPEGEPLPDLSLEDVVGLAHAWVPGPDRTSYQRIRRIGLPGGMPSGTETGDLVITRNDLGEVLDTAAVLPLGSTFPWAAHMPDVSVMAHESVWHVLTDGSVVTNWDSEYSIEVRDGGVLRRIIRLPVPRRPLTERDRERFQSVMREVVFPELDFPEVGIERFEARFEFEAAWPAIARLLGGPGGTLWVQRVDPDVPVDLGDMTHAYSLRVGSADWDVFDPEGRYLGQVAMPRYFEPLRVVGDAIYGLERDADGVPEILRLRVRRGGEGDVEEGPGPNR